MEFLQQTTTFELFAFSPRCNCSKSPPPACSPWQYDQHLKNVWVQILQNRRHNATMALVAAILLLPALAGKVTKPLSTLSD